MKTCPWQSLQALLDGPKLTVMGGAGFTFADKVRFKATGRNTKISHAQLKVVDKNVR